MQRTKHDLTFDEFLKKACPGLDLEWRKYRRRSARRNVERRLRELGVEGFSSYLDMILEDPAEAGRLPDIMRVTVSRFFRERELWDSLERAFPLLLDKRAGGTIRAWSAGCCGGEEPYSLAILWLERLQPRYSDLKMEITATDIDAEALKRALAGRYSKSSMREIPPEYIERHFTSERGAWTVSNPVRRLVEFKKSNLLADPAPSGMDIVLCRYLAFTYFRGKRLLAAINKLYEALEPGGLLMVGEKEPLPPAALEFFHPVPDIPGLFEKSF